MNNPFDYEPSALMLSAQQTLISHIEAMRAEHRDFAEEVDKGKMFGILRCEEKTLYAFSGQVANRYDWDGFVPAVFDFLDETGYFKTHEAEITAINKEVEELLQSPKYGALKSGCVSLQHQADEDIDNYRMKMKAAKMERDMLRSSGLADDERLIKESQFMKAELHRRRLQWRARIDEAAKALDEYEGTIRSLKMKRQRMSDELQRWLFQQFVFTNYQGEQQSLLDIFGRYHDTTSAPLIPPSGTGECCEPKLLNYAFTHALTPVEIGMFWWGESPRQEVRHHLQFYPACNGKCKPILSFMLPISTLLSPHSSLLSPLSSLHSTHSTLHSPLDLCYEDDAIIVVNKPAGMLSVPGRSKAPSVFSLLKESHPGCPELQMVHRLDMDTSGLLVVAKTSAVHKMLQQQFLEHSVSKTYIALLEHNQGGEGCIALPLRPDYEDRPRQMVDIENGKPALTFYKSLGHNRIELHPRTGRTHQLRMHCAHKEGLGNPIKGDRLYGSKADRLYLHAATLEFEHPLTGAKLTFHKEPQF